MHYEYAAEYIANIMTEGELSHTQAVLILADLVEDEILDLAESAAKSSKAETISDIIENMRLAEQNKYKRVTHKQSKAVAGFLMQHFDSLDAVLCAAFNKTVSQISGKDEAKIEETQFFLDGEPACVDFDAEQLSKAISAERPDLKVAYIYDSNEYGTTCEIRVKGALFDLVLSKDYGGMFTPTRGLVCKLLKTTDAAYWKQEVRETVIGADYVRSALAFITQHAPELYKDLSHSEYMYELTDDMLSDLDDDF